MYGRNSGDNLMVCPYDATHQILAKSFSNHLVKCRANNATSHKKVTCRFNSLHQIPKPEISHHESQCPDQYLMIRELQGKAGMGANILTGHVIGPEIVKSHLEEVDEDWDSAPVFKSQALFDRKIEVEEEPQGPYIPPGANYRARAPLFKPSNQQADEDGFRKVPLAPSKAAQISAPLVSAQPLNGSSDQVFQFSHGNGVGRGTSLNYSHYNPNVGIVEPQRRATQAPGYSSIPGQGPRNPQSIGRGVSMSTNHVSMSANNVSVGRGLASNSDYSSFARGMTTDAAPPSFGRGVARYADSRQANFSPRPSYPANYPHVQDPNRQMNFQNFTRETVVTNTNPNWQATVETMVAGINPNWQHGLESDSSSDESKWNFQLYQQQQQQQHHQQAMYQRQFQNSQTGPRPDFSNFQTVTNMSPTMPAAMFTPANTSFPVDSTPWAEQHGYAGYNVARDVQVPDLKATETQKDQPGDRIGGWPTQNFTPSQNLEGSQKVNGGAAGLSPNWSYRISANDSSNPETASEADSSSAIDSLSQSLSSHSLLDTEDDSSQSSRTEEEAAVLREKRKLVKRLKQMTALEEKASKGEKLTDQEKFKLEKKEETVKALENISKTL